MLKSFKAKFMFACVVALATIFIGIATPWDTLIPKRTYPDHIQAIYWDSTMSVFGDNTIKLLSEIDLFERAEIETEPCFYGVLSERLNERIPLYVKIYNEDPATNVTITEEEIRRILSEDIGRAAFEYRCVDKERLNNSIPSEVTELVLPGDDKVILIEEQDYMYFIHWLRSPVDREYATQLLGHSGEPGDTFRHTTNYQLIGMYQLVTGPVQ